MTPATQPPWIENPFGLVSLRDIVERVLIGDVVTLSQLSGSLTGVSVAGANWAPQALDVEVHEGDENLRFAIEILESTQRRATLLGLDTTLATLDRYLPVLRNPQGMALRHVIGAVETVHGTFRDELSTRIFLAVGLGEKRLYESPQDGWGEAIGRFPETTSDVVEAGKCLALDRYAASIYHTMQVFEHGLIALGRFMRVTDPKSGFTAVSNALLRVTSLTESDRTPFEKQHRVFFQEMHASTHAVQEAWRNKISHAQGKAVLLTADFSREVAHEIWVSTRAFMRRLATEMPS